MIRKQLELEGNYAVQDMKGFANISKIMNKENNEEKDETKSYYITKNARLIITGQKREKKQRFIAEALPKQHRF